MIKNIFNCISIHNGGGITYLSLMHSEIDKKGNLIFLDNRAKKYLKPFINAETKFFKKNLFRNIFVLKERLKHTLIFRRYLRKKNKKEYIKEFFLNGIPPLFRFPISTNKIFILCQNKNLFTYINYFDNKLFFKLNFLIYLLIHSILINFFLRESDTIIVQTNSMRKRILSMKTKNRIILEDHFWKNITLEFYNENILGINRNQINNLLIEKINNISKNNKIFFYPSSFLPHKNHKILFEIFRKLDLNSKKNIKLLVTIDQKEVPSKYRNNESIYFIGKQSPYIVNQIYKIADFLIFPSLNESLGLPLIEASFYNLPIISSNLDYVFDVCNPILTFNPYSGDDIYRKILDSIN